METTSTQLWGRTAVSCGDGKRSGMGTANARLRARKALSETHSAAEKTAKLVVDVSSKLASESHGPHCCFRGSEAGWFELLAVRTTPEETAQTEHDGAKRTKPCNITRRIARFAPSDHERRTKNASPQPPRNLQPRVAEQAQAEHLLALQK